MQLLTAQSVACILMMAFPEDQSCQWCQCFPLFRMPSIMNVIHMSLGAYVYMALIVAADILN
jgi:hypothetical protein